MNSATKSLTDLSNETASLIARMGSGKTAYCAYRALAAKRVEEMQAVLAAHPRVPKARAWQQIVGYHLDAF